MLFLYTEETITTRILHIMNIFGVINKHATLLDSILHASLLSIKEILAQEDV